MGSLLSLLPKHAKTAFPLTVGELESWPEGAASPADPTQEAPPWSGSAATPRLPASSTGGRLQLLPHSRQPWQSGCKRDWDYRHVERQPSDFIYPRLIILAFHLRE